MRLRFVVMPTLVLSAWFFTTQANAQWYQGPSGSPGGQAYDGWVANQHKTNINGVEIVTNRSALTLHCIVAEYGTAGASGSGAAGPDNCNISNMIDIGVLFPIGPDEFLVGISGTYTDHITSLRLYTNKKNSPLYGEGQSGQIFGYTAPAGQMIVAFQQNLDIHLRSIGVMYAPR